VSIRLYSDGGADSRKRSGAACILEGIEGQGTLGFACFLGAATNNEAEIFSALMGFAIVRALSDRSGQEVYWISDSEYCLKSATQYMKNWIRNGWKTSQKEPVKNQGLWRTFNSVTETFRIIPEHVRGHTGHPQNEACDTAVGWIREHAEDFGRGDHAVEIVEMDNDVCNSWCIIDARRPLDQIRKAEDRGLEAMPVISYFSNALGSALSSQPGSRTSSPRPQTSTADLSKIVKLTNAYLKKLDELSDAGNLTLSKDVPEINGAVRQLRDWVVKRG